MEDRRTLIADAAIEVIARDGVRALTHRAVDAEAGLPSGSTSYYCRTRAQLLELTCERLVALLRGFVETSGVQELRPADTEAVVDALVGMVSGLLDDYRGELAARSALVVELAGTSDTADLLASLLDPSDIIGALGSAGIKEADVAAEDLLITFEGLLWERTIGRLAGLVDPARDAEVLGGALAVHGHKSSRGLFGLRR